MKEPGKIAAKILALIDKDVNKITEDFKDVRFDADTALTLTRYLKSVFDAKSDQAEDLKEYSEKLSELSNDDLKKMATSILNRKLNESGT